MDRPLRISISISLFVIAFQLSLQADSLRGRVLDPQGQRVANAALRLFDRNKAVVRQTQSSSDGDYAFQGIAAGDYLLEAEASASALTKSQPIHIDGDQTADVSLVISSNKTEVVVTASSTPLALAEVSKALDVVDSDQIALRDELSIAEAIRNLPGIRVKQTEGPGSFTTLRTRGLRAQDTEVLIDGMRFRDPSSISGEATAFVEELMTVDTDRVEFLRGSGSSLYGSHALGGVVNISSRPGGGPPHGEFRAEGGGLGMLRGVLGIGGGVAADRFTYSSSVSHLNVTKGVRDGLPYRNTSSQSSAKFNLTPHASLSARIWGSSGYLAATESPLVARPEILANVPATGPVKAIPLALGELKKYEANRTAPLSAGNATYIPSQIDPDGRRMYTFLSGLMTFQHQIGSDLSYHVSYQGLNTSRPSIDGPAGPGQFEPASISRSQFDGHTKTLQLRSDYRAGAHNLVSLGYEFEDEQYFSFNDGNRSNFTDLRERSQAVYGQDQINLFDGRLQFTVAARTQSFNVKAPVFSGTTPSPYQGVALLEPPRAYTGDGALAYFVRPSQTKFRAHVGNSFRAPSGYERLGPFGDPRLRPERAISVDGGIDQWLMGSKVQASATVFYTKLQETVRFLSLAAGDPFARRSGYGNGGGGISRGVELSAHISPVSSTNLQMSYTYTNSDSLFPTIGTNYYKQLGLSDHMFALTATQWIAQRFNVTFDLYAMSDYTLQTLFGRQYVYDSPVRGDVVAHYDLPIADDKTLELYDKVENVFNKRAYEDGFVGPKAWMIAGLRLKY